MDSLKHGDILGDKILQEDKKCLLENHAASMSRLHLHSTQHWDFQLQPATSSSNVLGLNIVTGLTNKKLSYQLNFFSAVAAAFRKAWARGQQEEVRILHQFDGLIRAGEMLLVLGRPGSGCSTLLKALSGNTYGFQLGQGSKINYQGKHAIKCVLMLLFTAQRSSQASPMNA